MFISKEFRRQLLASTPVFFNELAMGLGYAWVAPTLRSLQNHHSTSGLSLTIEESSWIASLHDFGRALGAMMTSLLLDHMGRKTVLAACSVSFFLIWPLIAFTRSITIIYAARIIFGLTIGVSDVTSAIYLCETFHPKLRGVLGSISMAFFFGTSLVEFCLVNYFSYDLVAYANSVIAFMALSNIFVSIETPVYLISRGKDAEALTNFLWLRAKEIDDKSICDAFEKVKRHIDSERKEERPLMALLRVKTYRKAITIVLVFYLLAMATGYASITSCVSMTFTAGTFTPNEYTMFFGTLQFFAVMFGSTIIEKVDRRTILMTSLLISAVMHASTATLLYLHNRIHIPYFSWLIFATITTYAMVYSSGIATVLSISRAELLPQNVRPIGGTIAIVGNSVVGFLTSKAFLLIANSFGMYWNFLFYSIVSFISVFFVYFVLPETRGKTLIQIQNSLEMRCRSKQ